MSKGRRFLDVTRDSEWKNAMAGIFKIACKMHLNWKLYKGSDSALRQNGMQQPLHYLSSETV
jgi:hypothetical protein